jgi:hypothetical protein
MREKATMGKSAILGFFKRRRAAQRLDLALNVLLIGRADVLTSLKEKHAKDWGGFVTEVAAGTDPYASAIIIILILVIDTLNNSTRSELKTLVDTMYEQTFDRRPPIFDLISQVGWYADLMEKQQTAKAGITVMFLNEIAKWFSEEPDHQKLINEYLTESVARFWSDYWEGHTEQPSQGESDETGQRRRYRNGVKAALNSLLIGFPLDVKDRMWGIYPKIKSSLATHQDDGENAEFVAVQIVIAVMPYFIEQINDTEWKARVIEQIKRAKDEKPTELFIRGLFTLEENTHDWALAGKFDMYLCDIMMSEIIGALAGKPADERRADRIADNFLRLVRESDANEIS